MATYGKKGATQEPKQLATEGSDGVLGKLQFFAEGNEGNTTDMIYFTA